MNKNNIIFRPLLSTTLAVSLLGASSVHAAKSPELNFNTLNKINSECLKEARQNNYDVSIAIFDAGGILLSYVQTDGAAPATGEVARWKGKSAAYYRTATAETAKWKVPTAPSIATVQGGVPIFTKNGVAVGGIGVSGAPPQFDEDCGVKAIQSVGFLSK